MGDDGGEVAGLFQVVWGSGGNGDNEGQGYGPGERVWIRHLCGPGGGRSGGGGEAHHRRENGTYLDV